MHYILNIEFKP